MTKVSYRITNGNTTFISSKYSDAVAWRDKGWTVTTIFIPLGEKVTLADALKD